MSIRCTFFHEIMHVEVKGSEGRKKVIISNGNLIKRKEETLVRSFRDSLQSLVQGLKHTSTHNRGVTDSRKGGTTMLRNTALSLMLIVTFSLPSLVYGQGIFGVRGGAGTDFAFSGMAYGGGVSYVWMPSGSNRALEISADVLLHRSRKIDSDFDSKGNHYDENLDLVVIGVKANMLFNYDPHEKQAFFIAGAGFGVGSIDWEEWRKPVDSYGNPTGERTLYDWEDGSAGAALLNLGFGYTLGNLTELRAEAPTYIFFNSVGGGTIIPTLSLGVIYRFG